MGEKKGNVKEFFGKLWDASFGSVNENKAKKMNAAFGTLLIQFLAGITILIAYWLVSNLNLIVATVLITMWGSIALCIGVIILVIFGSSETAETENLLDSDKVEMIIAKKIDSIIDKVIKEKINKILDTEPAAFKESEDIDGTEL